MDKFRIDSHKLMYHVARVNSWFKGKDIYPIYMEISPIGSCNHRCIYCALDFMKYQGRCIDKNILNERLAEMNRLGVRSIMYAGEGEPFLHKDIIEIVNSTKDSGMDTAVTTNGVLFNKKLADSILEKLTWIRISINSGTKETYAKIHNTRPSDFNTVIQNMSYASRIRRQRKIKCTLGMQLILLPENYQECTLLAKKARDIGMDYLVVKPYSQHPLSITKRYKDIKYAKYLDLERKLYKFNTKEFNVIFRIHTMRKWDEQGRDYKSCLALGFWAYVSANGDVWGCSIYLTKENFLLGNIYKNSFQEIWQGKKREKFMRWARQGIDIKKCRINCRMDEINCYLWELKHPSEHVNFI